MNQKMRMTTNKELEYKDIEEIVEYLVSVKAHQHTFDCWDFEDIGQEIRIICLNALKKFDREKVTSERGILNYFGTCVDNRLQNLKRDKYIRYNPSFKIDVEDVEKKHDVDSKLYRKYLKFKEDLKSRINIKHPISIDIAGDIFGNGSFEDEIVAQDLKRFLLNTIDDELKFPLLTMLAGDKRSVDIKIRRKIQDFVKGILANHKDFADGIAG